MQGLTCAKYFAQQGDDRLWLNREGARESGDDPRLNSPRIMQQPNARGGLSASMLEREGTAVDLVTRLKEFYELNNPEVLPDEVEEIAAFYAGRDVRELNSMLRNKYQGHDLTTVSKQRDDRLAADSVRQPLEGVFDAAAGGASASVTSPTETCSPRDLRWEWQKETGVMFMKKMTWEPFSEGTSADLQAAADAARVRVDLQLERGEAGEARLDTMQFRRLGGSSGSASEWVVLRTPRASRWQYFPRGGNHWCAFDGDGSAVLEVTHASSAGATTTSRVPTTRIKLQISSRGAKAWHSVRFDDMTTSVDGNEMSIRPPPRPQAVRLPLTGLHKQAQLPDTSHAVAAHAPQNGPRQEEITAQRRANLKTKIFLKVYTHETENAFKTVDCTQAAGDALAAADTPEAGQELPSGLHAAMAGAQNAGGGADAAAGASREHHRRQRGSSFSDAADRRVADAAGLLTVRALRELIAEKLQVTDAGAEGSNYGLYLVRPPAPGAPAAAAAAAAPGGGATGRRGSNRAAAVPPPAAAGLGRELKDDERPLCTDGGAHEFGYVNMEGSNGARLVYRTRCYYWRPGPGGLGLSFYDNGTFAPSSALSPASSSAAEPNAGLTVKDFSPPVDGVQGQAQASGLVVVGDQLVQVNGGDMTGLSLGVAKKILHDAWQVFQGGDGKAAGRPLTLMFRALGKGKRRKGEAHGTHHIRHWLSQYFKKHNPAFLKLRNPRPYGGEGEDDTALELAVSLFHEPKPRAALGEMLFKEYGEDLETFMGGTSSASRASPSGRRSPTTTAAAVPSPPRLVLPGASALAPTKCRLPGADAPSTGGTPKLTGAYALAAKKRGSASARVFSLSASGAEPGDLERSASALPLNLRSTGTEHYQLLLAHLSQQGGPDANWPASPGSSRGLPSAPGSSVLKAYRDLYLRSHNAAGDAVPEVGGAAGDGIATGGGSGDGSSAPLDTGRRRSLVARTKALFQKRGFRRSSSGRTLDETAEGSAPSGGRALQRAKSQSSIATSATAEPQPFASLRGAPAMGPAAVQPQQLVGGSLRGASAAPSQVNMRLNVAREIMSTEVTYLARLNALGEQLLRPARALGTTLTPLPPCVHSPSLLRWPCATPVRMNSRRVHQWAVCQGHGAKVQRLAKYLGYHRFV